MDPFNNPFDNGHGHSPEHEIKAPSPDVGWAQGAFRSSNDMLMEDSENTQRSVAIDSQHAYGHQGGEKWYADLDKNFGLPSLGDAITKQKLNQGLPTSSSAWVAPASTVFAPEVALEPNYFAKSTSFYTREGVSHDDLLRELSIALTNNANADHTFSKRDQQISGMAYGSAEHSEGCSWMVSVFKPKCTTRAGCLLVEFKKTFGCAFAFRQLYFDTATAVGGLITAFVTSPPCAPKPALDLDMDMLDCSQLPPLCDLPPLAPLGGGSDLPPLPALSELGSVGFGCTNATDLEASFALASSRYFSEQQDGLLSLLRIAQSPMDVCVAGKMVDLLRVPCHPLLLSVDSTVSRHSCHLLETLCADPELCPRVLIELLDKMMAILDSPDSLASRKNKRHMAKALEIATKTSPTCARHFPPQYVQVLKTFQDSEQLAGSISNILAQLAC